MLGIIEIPDPSESADFAEMGLILPVPGTDKNSIVLEARDGQNVQRFTAREVHFKVGGQVKLKDPRVKIDLLVTDARFALACSNHDKGGGHMFFGAGALTLDVAVNAASKARARLRSRGQMLVGQVRYPWVRRVGHSPKSGFGKHESIYVEAEVAGGGTTLLILYVPNDVSAAQVAAEVATRAARYRLATKDLGAEDRKKLDALAAGAQPLAGSDGKKVYYHTLPGSDQIDDASARLAPATA